MRHVFLGVIAVASVLVIAGCGQQSAQQPNSEQTPAVIDQTSKTPESIDSEQEPLGSVAINSVAALKDALAGGKTLECTYKFAGAKEGVSEVKGFIDGKRYKSTYAVAEDNFTMIMDGEVMYSWSEKTKQGTKMSIACMEEAAKNASQTAGQQNYKSSEEMVDHMTDINCEPTSDVDFSIPGDITFADTCQQMKDAMQMMNQMKDKVPANIPDNIPMPAN